MRPLPGPGGIFLIAPGVALILKTSMWAKRHYVRVKRWQPKAGRWMDWALRRPSHQRREALRKAEQEREVSEAGPGIDLSALLHYRRARQRLPLGRPFFI